MGHWVEKNSHRRPETAILREASLQDWLLAGIWELGFRVGSHHSLTDGASGRLCLPCAYSIIYHEHPLLSGRLEFWSVLNRGCVCEQPPIKTSGTESLMSFPRRQHFTNCCHKMMLEQFCPSCVTQWGEDSWKHVPGFLWTSLHAPFVDFAVINHHHESYHV